MNSRERTMAKTKAELKAALDAAKKKAAAATKAYQGTSSYADNYAEVKAANDGAINDLNAAQDAYEKSSAKPKAKPSVKTQASMEYDTPEDALKAAQSDVQEWSRSIDTYPVGSAAYNNAKANLDAAQQKVSDLQTQIGAKKNTAESSKATKEVQSAQSAYDEAVTRAKDKGLDPNLDPRAVAAKKKLDDASGKAKSVDAPTSGLTLSPATPQEGNQFATNTSGTSGASGTSGSSGTATSGNTPAATDTSGGGKYANVKGVLNYNGQPFTGQYNDKYYSAGKVETAEQIKADFISKFGVQAALVASDPELSALFTQAVSAPSQGGGWSADKWKTEFENTQWYKTRTSAARASEMQRVSSPVDYSQAYNNARQKAQMVAAAEGIQLTDKQLGAAIPDADLSKVKARDVTGQDLAQWVLDNNPTDAQLRAHLIQVGQVNATALGGAIQANAQQLKQYANDLGLNNMVLPASSKDGLDFFGQSAKQIEAGTTSLEAQKQYLINLAKSNFPAYAAQLDSGITVRQLAAPYINTVANLLEIAPEQVDLSKADGYGNMVFKALQGNNDPKNPVPMDLSTFQNQVRSMPQWLNTQNAKTSILDSGSQLLQTFGLVR